MYTITESQIREVVTEATKAGYLAATLTVALSKTDMSDEDIIAISERALNKAIDIEVEHTIDVLTQDDDTEEADDLV